MLLEVALVSLVVGAVLVLLIQLLLFKLYMTHTPPQPAPYREQFPAFVLPQMLKSKLLGDGTNLQQKEACLWLNLMGQFLFQELRDTSLVRRWVMRKMNLEFQELLQTTSGKLLAQIVVRDFSLGSACPVIGGVSVQHFNLEEDLFQSLDVCMDVEYDGGFTLGIDVVLPFNKMAFISVTLRQLCGRARLQLTRHPYTHWSFSFLQEPEVQFEVESHFEGRPLSQVAALIVNQLRRTIRKKHTLPNYKMRFKPVFSQPEIRVPTCRLLVNGQCVTVGRLCITFIKCSRLTLTSQDATLYCILSADSKPWRELVRGKDKVWVTVDIEISKGQADTIGINVKDEYLLDRYGMAVTVDYIQTDSPAARADIKKGDVLISVGPTRVVSSKHAAKLLKNAGDKFALKLERAQLKVSQETKIQEDAAQVKEGESEVVENSLVEDGEEFVNITVQPPASDPAFPHSDAHGEDAGSDLKEKAAKGTAGMHLSHSAGQLRRPRSGTDLSTCSAPVLGRRGGTEGSTPTSSPRLRRASAVAVPQGTAQDSGPGVNTNEVSKAAVVLPGSRAGQDHSPSPSSGCMETLLPDRKGAHEDETFSVYSADSDTDDESSPVMKTREVPASQNPRWHDPLSFDLTEQHLYLNVCVWCHSVENTDTKADRPTPPPHRDVLLGQVSVPVNMLTLQCLMTMQGDSKQTLELQPGQLKTGVSRKTMVGHIGFEPQRCFGDITLRFQFMPANLNEVQRTRLTRSLDPSEPAELASAGIVPASQDSSQEEQTSDSESLSGEGRHMFAKTQFNSATYCNFCGKKIWLKEAFQCSVCGMISHKKCVDKCRAETLCSQDGPRRRSAPGEFWRTPVRTKKLPEDEAGLPTPKPPTRSSRILSKFTKDSASKAADKDAAKSSGSPRLLRRRKETPTKVAGESEPAMPSDLQFLHGTLDDTAMTSAKQLGRQLFSQLDIAQRKARLDHLVNKMQDEIDQESANKVALSYDLQEAETEAARNAVKVAMAKSNEKMEALMLLLLQYCAGLQHCLDQEEEVRQQTTTSEASNAPSDAVPEAAASAVTDAPAHGLQQDMVEAFSGKEEEQQQTVQAVAQALTKLIDTDDSSSSEEENHNNNDDDDDGEADIADGAGTERFQPILQENGTDSDGVLDISGSDLARAQAMLSGIPTENMSDIERDVETTSV